MWVEKNCIHYGKCKRKEASEGKCISFVCGGYKNIFDLGERLPIMTCPKCGYAYEDFDGLGVIYCEKCGYCKHASSQIVKGKEICDYCGGEL